MPTEPRLTWIQHAPEPGGIYFAECGMYSFEISKAPEPGTGYLLQMWQTRPEDWPLVVWEMDGFNLDEAKERPRSWRPSTLRRSSSHTPEPRGVRMRPGQEPG
jgi:hypothetical protein